MSCVGLIAQTSSLCAFLLRLIYVAFNILYISFLLVYVCRNKKNPSNLFFAPVKQKSVLLSHKLDENNFKFTISKTRTCVLHNIILSILRNQKHGPTTAVKFYPFIEFLRNNSLQLKVFCICCRYNIK